MTMKHLVVRTPHAVVEELDECHKLFDYVSKVASDNKVDEIVILGDLNNTHNVVRVEVMNFWQDTLRDLSKIAMTRVLVGNHDYAGEGSDQHSLTVYGNLSDSVSRIQIVDTPIAVGKRLYQPYYSDAELLVKDCQSSPDCSVLFCHQTFAGSTLDNGFYAPEGVDPNLLPQTTIISGHIHSPQRIGKVIYVGSPRWRTMDDANKDRAIRIFEIDGNGTVTGDTAFPTNKVCREIRRAIDTPENPVVIPEGDTARWHIDVRGPADWVEERKKAFGGNVRLRTFKTAVRAAEVRESEGIAVAFSRYIKSYNANGVAPEVLQAMAKERLDVC